MSNEIKNLQPQAVWNNFYQLTQIPRPSKKEEKIIEYMKNWGEERGLETVVDAIGNVIIKKPATPGMEDRKGIILQGHLDMVPQKNNDSTHDFEKDPIDAYVDGDWVTAKGTTLGADNGMGVAAAMAILEATDIAHGPIEALMTIDEETGMTGAENLKPGFLDGDILLNLDSEDEGELYIGCAGGIDTNVEYTFQREEVPADHAALKVTVSGLKGGHSGLDIHLGKGNACLILNKVLNGGSQFGVRVANFEAGTLRNAIPRDGFAEVVMPTAKKDAFVKFVNESCASEQNSYKHIDPELKITVEETDLPEFVIDKKTQQGLFSGVANALNGVIAFDANMPDVVETSSNLAIIKFEDNHINIAILTRSANDAKRDKAAKEIADNFRENDAEATHQGAYPGWQPNVNSPILEAMKKVYNDNWGKVPEVKVIHAGLECGILGAIYNHWDMISFGPTIRFPHSPDEKVNIKTVAMFYDYLVETLKNVPKK